MTRSVMDKIRTAQAERAALKKRITAVSVTAAALVVCLVAGFAASGGLRMGTKSAEARDEKYVDYDIVQPEAAMQEENGIERSKNGSKSAASGAADVTSVSYEELSEMLPGASPLKNLTEKGFETVECAVQFAEGKEDERAYSGISVIIIAFTKDGAAGEIICRPGFTGTAEEYAASKPLSYPETQELEAGGIKAVCSADNSYDCGAYNAAFVTDGALYEIKASAESPEEISALIEALLTES